MLKELHMPDTCSTTFNIFFFFLIESVYKKQVCKITNTSDKTRIQVLIKITLMEAIEKGSIKHHPYRLFDKLEASIISKPVR